MKIYIAGKINGEEGFKEKFASAQQLLEAEGHIVLNPAELPEGMRYEDYMEICFAMIRVADALYTLSDWQESPGACREVHFAEAHQKKVVVGTLHM